MARSTAAALGLTSGANPSVRGYLDAPAMIKGAKREGVDVNDYIERAMGWPGFQAQADAYVDHLVSLGALGPDTAGVLEIGSGSGRHVRAVLARCPGVDYTAYEPDPLWRTYLAGAYGIKAPEAPGESLAATPDGSVSFVHAHAVMVYVPFLTAAAYFNEVARVLRTGGYFSFNAHTEDTFSEAAIAKWLAGTYRYPAIFPREHLIALLANRGFRLVEQDDKLDGESRYFLFLKEARTPSGTPA